MATKIISQRRNIWIPTSLSDLRWFWMPNPNYENDPYIPRREDNFRFPSPSNQPGHKRPVEKQQRIVSSDDPKSSYSYYVRDTRRSHPLPVDYTQKDLQGLLTSGETPQVYSTSKLPPTPGKGHEMKWTPHEGTLPVYPYPLVLRK